MKKMAKTNARKKLHKNINSYERTKGRGAGK